MSSGMTYMTFVAYEDNLFKKLLKQHEYQVKINPETFDRSISLRTNNVEPANGNGTQSYDAGTEAETYSFDLLFDGTGVVGSISSAAELKKEFDKFLSVVYRDPKGSSSEGQSGKSITGGNDDNNGNQDKKTTPAVNFVKIKYCGETFKAKLDSLSIKYLLFHKDGNPLRIRVSCRFSSAEEPSSTGKGTSDSDSAESSAPSIDKDSPNKDCVHPDESFEKTVSSAIQNDAMSLLTCSYTREEMTPGDFSSALLSLAE